MINTFLAFVVASASAFAAPPAITSPEVASKVTSCLKDYVVLLNNIETALKTKKAVDDLKAKCLSPEFLKNWNAIVKKTDANPLLCAQDINPTWLTQASVVKSDATSKTMRVNLGSGDETYCLDLGLTPVGDQWKINSSKVCSK